MEIGEGEDDVTDKVATYVDVLQKPEGRFTLVLRLLGPSGIPDSLLDFRALLELAARLPSWLWFSMIDMMFINPSLATFVIRIALLLCWVRSLMQYRSFGFWRYLVLSCGRL